MKIVILPGVGFQEKKNGKIIKYIKQKIDADVVWFNWKHNLKYPDVHLKYNIFRRWIAEVIFDFQYVINHSKELVIPEADYYIAHSAGSLIALSRDVPCVTLGSPTILVEQYQNHGSTEFQTLQYETCKTVLNIVNPFDVLSYPIPFPHIDNEYLTFCHWNPLKAHTGYLDNKEVCKRVVSRIRSWETIKKLDYIHSFKIDFKENYHHTQQTLE